MVGNVLLGFVAGTLLLAPARAFPNKLFPFNRLFRVPPHWYPPSAQPPSAFVEKWIQRRMFLRRLKWTMIGVFAWKQDSYFASHAHDPSAMITIAQHQRMRMHAHNDERVELSFKQMKSDYLWMKEVMGGAENVPSASKVQLITAKLMLDVRRRNAGLSAGVEGKEEDEELVREAEETLGEEERRKVQSLAKMNADVTDLMERMKK
ncbi:hypothetical protein BT69DRAFT_1299374 [Atractiella rhizophila]|nr:hypothetical protein BT69DRAFT_1299374 [Atractiella rhizophila]